MKKHCDIENCNAINSGIDPCIQEIIKALNDGGIETIASCCGHGNTIGTIVLKDRRELMIAPDFESARQLERGFPDIHGNHPRTRGVVEMVEWVDDLIQSFDWSKDDLSMLQRIQYYLETEPPEEQ